MRFAVCLLVLLAGLGGVEGGARFRLTFYKSGLESSPDCDPLAEAELAYADGEKMLVGGTRLRGKLFLTSGRWLVSSVDLQWERELHLVAYHATRLRRRDLHVL
jgi:hypothetical protein